MEDDYKNLLDDIDFCLRKCIAVYCVKKYRKKKHLSQGKLGESLGVTQSTVSDWENDMGSSEFKIDSMMNSRLATTPLTILKFSAYAHISIAEMVWDVISEEERKPKFCKPEILDEIKKIGAGLKITTTGKSCRRQGFGSFWKNKPSSQFKISWFYM